MTYITDGMQARIEGRDFDYPAYLGNAKAVFAQTFGERHEKVNQPQIVNAVKPRRPVVKTPRRSHSNSPEIPVTYDSRFDGSATHAEHEKLEAVNAPSGCRTCNRRVPLDREHGLSWGYCEGCSFMSRKCPACSEHKEQKGWGYGWELDSVGLKMRPGWVCPDCKDDKTNVMTQHPTFTVTLDMSPVARFMLRAAIGKGPGLPIGGAPRALVRIHDAIQNGDTDLVIDVSDADQVARDMINTVLSNIVNDIDREAQDAATELRSAWASLVWKGKQPVASRPKPRPITEAEKSILTHDERPLNTD